MNRRTRSTIATLLLAALLTTSVVPPSPAAAADLAAANCDDSRSSAHFDVYVAANACDTDDATFWVCTICWAGGPVYLSVDLDTSQVLGRFRVKTVPGNAGGIYFAYSDDGTTFTNANSQLVAFETYGTSSGSGANEVRLYDFTIEEATAGAPCLPTCDVATSHRYWRIGTSSGNGTAGFRVYSFELFEGVQTRPFEDYVYALQITHPQFARQIGWLWRITWAGEWSITDADDDVLASGSGGIQNNGAGVRIQCPIICGSDTYTIHIHEGDYSEVTYVIDGEDSGFLIPDARAAAITFVEACYNPTLNGCVNAILDGPADSMGARFTLTARPGNAEHDNTGTVSFGRYDLSSSVPCTFVGSPVTTAVLELGTYTQLVSAWDQSAGFFNADGDQLMLVRWDSAIDPGYYDCKVVALDVTSGTTTTVTTPVDGVTPCALTDPACNIGRAFEIAIANFFGLAEDVWSGAIAEVHDAAASKLPFAYVVLAFDGISAQLAVLSAEVDNSDDCPGVTFAVPLYYGTSPLTPDPTTLPITVLKCEQLEPFMGSSWYQAIRTAMDPALWLLFAWGQFKSLQPKPSLNG